ncbi:MAG: DUF4347 domain-containing protein, partial [Gammaproteobacteria bacterium]|nr:DUF4347 domain-containing protein [Gammaproteobacteria bacterium]
MKASPTATAREPFLFEELEPRVLFSADFAPGLVDLGPQEEEQFEETSIGAELAYAQDENQNSLVAADLDTVTANVTVRHEIVFVDANTPNSEQLINGLLENPDDSRQIEVVYLDSERDGVEQITEALAGQQNLDAVHIISHGSDSGVQLGDTWLEAGNLQPYTEAIKSWSSALDAEADLLFYGCDLAGGADGRALLGAIGGLTGADVAASDDLTGNALLGGDWDLEFRLGDIESAVALSAEAQQSFEGVLAVVASDDFSSGDYTGGTGWTGGWVDSHNGDPTGGRIGVSGGALYIDENGGSHNIYREADLSAYGNGTLSYDYKGAYIGATGTYTVELGYGGGNWRTVATHVVSSSDGSFIASGDIALTANELAADFQFRISSSGADEDTQLEIDNVTITVAVNDAPVLTGANDLTAISEDPVSNPGTLVSDLISSQVSDADTGALSGIAVIGVDDTNGTWEYTTDGGSNWFAFGAVDTTSARLLSDDASTYVRFVPDPDWNGTVSNGLTFHAWDQTSGTAGSTTDLTVNHTLLDQFGGTPS